MPKVYSSHSFPRSLRLLRPADYQRVFKQATRKTLSFLTFYLRHNKLGYARIGFAISKKMLPKAHDRNLVKRLVRESFRCATGLPGLDIVVVLNKARPVVERKQVQKDLQKTWLKLSQSVPTSGRGNANAA